MKNGCFATANSTEPLIRPEPRPLRQHTRRSFLRTAGALLAAQGVVPLLLPSRARGALAANDRLALAHIGVGGQGSGLLRNFIHPDVSRTVAVCDTFKSRRESNAAYVNQRYGGGNVCTPYADLREMLARDDIDAVVIATPDHWHVPAALLAVRAGKDVYVEKPLGHSVAQDLAMRAACRRYGAVFQYGTQQRSQSHVRFGCELVRNGRIGKILAVEVVSPASATGGSTAPVPVPDGFDYDMWLGPAPEAPYTKDRCTNAGAWYVSDYALGFIAGWGAHPLDVAVWGMGDTTAAVPVSYEGTGAFPTDGLFDTATSWDVRCRYADRTDFRFRGPGGNLTIFTGETGKVAISRGGLETEPTALRNEVIGPDERHLHESPNHYLDFLEGVRTRRRTVSPVDVAVLSDTISHLSDIAIRTGRRIAWDNLAETVPNDETARRMLSHALRAPWVA